MKADNRKTGLPRLKINSERYKTMASPDNDKIQIPTTTKNNVQKVIKKEVEENITNNMSENDTLTDLERRMQNIAIKSNNIKPEPNNEYKDNSIDDLTNNIESLDVKDTSSENIKRDEDDRIARGPERLFSTRLQMSSTPYVKTGPNRLHQCGGNVVENLPFQLFNSSTTTTTLNNVIPDYYNTSSSVQSTTNFSGNFTLNYQPVVPSLGGCYTSNVQQETQQDSLYTHQGDIVPQPSSSQDISGLPAYSSTPNIPVEYDENSLSNTIDSLEELSDQEVINELSDIDRDILEAVVTGFMQESNNTTTVVENYNTEQQSSSCFAVDIPSYDKSTPNHAEFSPYYLGSVGSSGYESSTSTPSNSPGPNNSNSPPNPSILNNIYQQTNLNYAPIPLTVEQISHVKPVVIAATSDNNQQRMQRKLQPILPKRTLTYTMQEKLYKYLISKENEQIIKRIVFIVNKNPLKMFTESDKDGDTALIKLATNPTAVSLHGAASSSSDFMSKLSKNPVIVRLACLYAVVERIDREAPKLLNHKNNSLQSALHLACTNAPDHPLIAAHIAETLKRHQVELNERCYATGCEEGGTLLHCIARLGDSHAQVMAELLEIPGAFKVDAFDTKTMLTPLQMAIKRHRIGGDNASEDFKVHKMVEILIKHGASTTVKDKNSFDCTPLQMALDSPRGPDMKLLQVLLKAKHNAVNVADLLKLQPVHYAARLSYQISIETMVEVLSLLVKHGATIKQDLKSHDGIMKMLQEDHKNYVRTLLFPQLQHLSM